MADPLTTQSYDAVIEALQDEDGFAVGADGLTVHGEVFAFVDGEDLIVELAQPRVADLLARGIVGIYVAEGAPSRGWVRVSDLQLWPELAREAHEFVGEPAVGGQS